MSIRIRLLVSYRPLAACRAALVFTRRQTLLTICWLTVAHLYRCTTSSTCLLQHSAFRQQQSYKPGSDYARRRRGTEPRNSS